MPQIKSRGSDVTQAFTNSTGKNGQVLSSAGRARNLPPGEIYDLKRFNDILVVDK